MGYNRDSINWKKLGEEFWVEAYNAKLLDTHLLRKQFLAKNGLQFHDYAWCKKCNHPFWNCKCGDTVFRELMEERTRMRKWSFEEKLKYSRELINRVLEENKGKKIYLAYSGGMDSECCLHLFEEAIKRGDVTVIYGDTLCDYPDTYLRLKECEEELGITIKRARPEGGMSFKKIVETYGMPIYSRGSKEKSKRIATAMCCQHLKKAPLHKITKDCEVIITGLRLEENEYRKLLILSRGDYLKPEKGTIKVYPIAFWTTEDEWKYQSLERFHYNKIYDYTNCEKKGYYRLLWHGNDDLFKIRSGCWSCPQSIPLGSDEWIQTYYPKLFHFLINEKGYNLMTHIVKNRRARMEKSQKRRPCGIERQLGI